MDRIIDSHCHPQFPQYDTDRKEMICRALDAGIQMICVGTDLNMSQKAIALAEEYEGVWASVGLHPNDDLDEVYDFKAYQSLASHSKVVAIGEIGLDYYRTTGALKKELQRSRFKQQLELARMVKKPVIIHCRDAHDDMQQLLPSEVRGVMHSFNGSLELASIYIRKGLYIGLNAIITFSKEYEVMVRSIPLDRMLLETDAPYLAPAPYRGQRNQPSYVEIIGYQIATIINQKPSAVFEATTHNAHKLFNIND